MRADHNPLDKIMELVDQAAYPLTFVGGWIDDARRKIEEQAKEIEELQGELTKASRANYESMRAKDRRIGELEHQLNHDLHAEGWLAAIKTLSDALTKAERERDELGQELWELKSKLAHAIAKAGA